MAFPGIFLASCRTAAPPRSNVEQALPERRSDIPLLDQHFPSRSDRLVTIRDDALERILSDCWSGNVRERKNVAPRAMVPSRRRHSGRLHPNHSGRIGAPGSWLEQLPHLKGYWNVIRKGKAQSLEAALEQPKGKKAEVMQALGIQRGVWAIGAELSTGYARFLKFRQRETDIDGRMLIVGTTSQELLNHPALCFGGRETIGAKISQPEGLR
jgi:transcriptional regulator with GAF, ATPase, and Fis domain